MKWKLDMRRLSQLLAAVCAACLSLSANAGMIIDGDFSSWSLGSAGFNGGTATATRESSGGTPGARLNITTFTEVNSSPAEVGYGLAIKDDYVTTDALADSSFTLSLDVLSGEGAFGQGQGISLLVEQAGAIYGANLGITGYPLNWGALSFNGTFNASSFTLLSGTGSGPDFHGGVATKFGFSARNSRSRKEGLTQYYDNFHLQSSAFNAVPEPGAIAIWGFAGAVGLVIARRRKRMMVA